MIRETNIKWIKWIDSVWLSEEKIKEIAEKYDFHELDIEACLEENQRSRVDSYDNYIFILLNFPKYNISRKIYEQNEFNIFLWKDFIITFRDFNNTHIDKIFQKYSDIEQLEKQIDKDEDHKLTSAFVLYEILQAMLEKLFKVRLNISKDLKLLEKDVFESNDRWLVKDIMIKKRNIVVLKHMLKPEIPVLKLIEFQVNKLFDSEIEVYFEDLEDKLEYVVNEIEMQKEHIESIEDAFKSIMDIKMNWIMTVLTLFSAFLLPLTLITWFYWMNIDPLFMAHNPMFVYSIFIVSIIVMILFFIYYKNNWKI
jgi:magnesium transporter